MSEEAKVIVAFDQLKRGDRIQVDIDHPTVKALVKSGYLKIIWRDCGTAAVAHSAGTEPGATGDLDPGAQGPTPDEEQPEQPEQPEEAVDGTRKRQPAKKKSPGA